MLAKNLSFYLVKQSWLSGKFFSLSKTVACLRTLFLDDFSALTAPSALFKMTFLIPLLLIHFTYRKFCVTAVFFANHFF